MLALLPYWYQNASTMIRHTLLFKFNEDVSEEARGEAVRRLRQLGELCPTVGRWNIGINFADSPSAYDVVEIGDFASIEALEAYKQHPAHRDFADYMRPLAKWALADYESGPDDLSGLQNARDLALNAYERLLAQRGDDPLLHTNAEETRRWMLGRGLPADDPEFITAALVGALTAYQKPEYQAFMETDQGPGMSETTKVAGQMATGAVIELAILLKNLIEPQQES